MQGLLTTVHFQKCNLQYQAFAFFEIVPSAQIMMVVASTLVALRQVSIPLHLLLLSSKDILVRWHSNITKCPLLCAFAYYSNTCPIVL